MGFPTSKELLELSTKLGHDSICVSHNYVLSNNWKWVVYSHTITFQGCLHCFSELRSHKMKMFHIQRLQQTNSYSFSSRLPNQWKIAKYYSFNRKEQYLKLSSLFQETNTSTDLLKVSFLNKLQCTISRLTISSIFTLIIFKSSEWM